MTPVLPAQRIAAIGVPAAIAVVALVAGGELVAAQNVKALWAIVAGGALLGFCYFSGNPRLFSLWALMVVLPLDVSKRLGVIIPKMGGENSIRFEITDLFIIVLAAYQLRDVWTARRPGIRIPRVTWLYGLILAYCFLSVIFGPYRTTAAHEIVRMLKMGLLFLVVANELTTVARISQAAIALLLGVLLQSCIGLVQFAVQGHLGLTILGETGTGTLDQLASDSLNKERAFRVGALLQHPNIFGAFLATLLPLGAGLFFIDRRPWLRIFYIVVMATGVAALVTTQSRSGWLSCFVAMSLLAILMWRRRRVARRMVRPALTALALTLAVLLALIHPITVRLLDSNPVAIEGRAEYARTAWGMIKAKPIMGWGLNSYVYEAPPFTRWGARGAKEFYEKSKNWLPPVHNIYLLWWSELGIIGLALHLAFIAWVLRTAARNLKVQDDMLFAVNIACIAGIAALLCDAMLSFTLRINNVLRVFWVICGLVYAVHYWRLTHPPEPPAT